MNIIKGWLRGVATAGVLWFLFKDNLSGLDWLELWMLGGFIGMFWSTF